MSDPDTFDWKKYLVECWQSTNYFCVATQGEEGVWNNPVFFAWDEDYNFFFISQMDTNHMQNLVKNPQIAVAIYNTSQKGDVAGTQITGTAKILGSNATKEEIQHAHNTYYGRAGHGPDVQDYINNPTWLYVKITPTNIYYFDTRFFKEKRQTVPLEKLK